jgi:hypothetical protein
MVTEPTRRQPMNTILRCSYKIMFKFVGFSELKTVGLAELKTVGSEG